MSMTSEQLEAKADRLWERAAGIWAGEILIDGDEEEESNKIARSSFRHYRRAAYFATGKRRRLLFERAIELAEIFLPTEAADRAVRDMVRDINAVPDCPAPNQMALFS